MANTNNDKKPANSIRLTPEQWATCDRMTEQLGLKSRNDFIRDAVDFYIAWQSRESVERVLTPSLESVIGGKIRDAEERLTRILFKLAVDQNLLARFLARYDGYRERMREIVEEFSRHSYRCPPMEMLFLELTARLKKAKGKKQYGYLDKNTKKIVNEIVKLLAVQPDLAELYDLWYKCKCEIKRTYTDADPMKIPIEENKEFKSIRNAVVNIAVHYGDRMTDDELKDAKKTTTVENNTPLPPKFGGYITALMRHASSIIDNSSAMEDSKAPVVDSKLRREIEQKKRGEMSMY